MLFRHIKALAELLPLWRKWKNFTDVTCCTVSILNSKEELISATPSIRKDESRNIMPVRAKAARVGISPPTLMITDVFRDMVDFELSPWPWENGLCISAETLQGCSHVLNREY